MNSGGTGPAPVPPYYRATVMNVIDTDRCLRLLADWARAAERFWYDIPDRPGEGCYGSGYDNWGVQTNQKYLAAMAVLATRGDAVRGPDRQWAMDRALAALRFSLASHVTGDGRCTDGTQWGRTWISSLGVERMMHAVYLLDEHLTPDDRAALRRMLTSEAEFIAREYGKDDVVGPVAGQWGAGGRNKPESNLWNGAVCWRTAAMYPDDPRVEEWRETAHRYLINAVSVPSDAEDETVVAGRPVRERHVGANFFPHYALDHHRYLNVGYMVICASNAAMLHFDAALAGFDPPESLYHHQADLWSVIRRMIFSDGRLARIGGDTRVRYAYCQDYLLPSLLLAADRLGDPHATGLAARQIEMIAAEQAAGGDGAFYGERCAWIRDISPYYYTRLESDRACVLGMAVAYGPTGRTEGAVAGTPEVFEESVAGAWVEVAHGAVMHRCPTRLASFAWRASGLTQGMCQPPDDGHLAEWDRNLAGKIVPVEHSYGQEPGDRPARRLLSNWIDAFEGGFITGGAVVEGAEVVISEGWRAEDAAVHRLVFVALPDGRTVVGLQHCRDADRRTYVREVQGLHLNIPNDLFNRFERKLDTASGTVALGRPERDEVLDLRGRWACIDGRVGVVGLYGAESLAISRSARRRGGKLHSLFVDELAWPLRGETWAAGPSEAILDAGWMVCSGVDAATTAGLCEANAEPRLDGAGPDMRAVRVSSPDGRNWLVAANFSDHPRSARAGGLLGEAAAARNPAGGAAVGPTDEIVLDGGRAAVWALQPR